MTIRLVASAPVGAPLAMSTLGAGARSLRAPATPSMTGRPRTGSKTPGWVTGPATGVGLDHVPPPLVDVDSCETSTGGIQAALPVAPPSAAVAGSSVRETAIASKPLKASSERDAAKLAVRLA